MTDWLGQHWVELAILVMLILIFRSIRAMADDLNVVREIKFNEKFRRDFGQTG